MVRQLFYHEQRFKILDKHINFGIILSIVLRKKANEKEGGTKAKNEILYKKTKK